MRSEIQWLVLMGLDEKLFSLQSCLTVAQSLEENVEIVPFAEELLNRKACTDFDALQRLVVEAHNKAQKETPPRNPFQRSPDDRTAGERIAHRREVQFPEFMTRWSQLENIQTTEAAADFMRNLLIAAQDFGCSDLHISAGSRPFVRHNCGIYYLGETDLSEQQAADLNLSLLSETQKCHFEENQDMDLALSLDTKQRFRTNLMMHSSGISGTYRIIPSSIPKLDELGFQDTAAIRKLLTYPNGLILVAGPVCSGKSATLAAMINDINLTRHDHLIAIEAPIEIIQKSVNCQVTQREVGKHTHSFSSALKSALRQDPDIIMIGELRDLEAIEIAITASETGHLVIGTLHTNDAPNTLNRIIDAFPPSQQTQVRVMLSHALRGIICQRLLPSKDQRMALAYELLICNTAVRTLISENKPEGIANVMETGAAEGMLIMDKSILALWESDRISDDTALSSLKSDMMRQQLRELIRLYKPTHASS